MKKKTAVALAVLVVVFVALALLIGITIGRQSGSAPEPEPQSASTPQDSPAAPSQSASASVPPVREPERLPEESIPYVGPIESPIIGKWEDKDMGTHQHNSYYEFSPDGSLLQTTYRLADKDYPENWYTHSYEFSFTTWRGQEVLESGFFLGYMHHRVEFYEIDGRQAMDIITIMDDDNSEYVSWTLLKIEE